MALSRLHAKAPHYWTETKPSCGDAGGTSRHEAQLNTKVDLSKAAYEGFG